VEGNLIDTEDIRRASDKTVVGEHGGQDPLEELPEEDGCEKTDCMKVGRGGHVGMEVGRVGARRDARLGRHSRSERENPEAKEDHGEADMRIYTEGSHREINLRAGNVWEVCLSMSNPNGGVCGIDEPRHADSVQRLGGVMIAVEASVVAAADVLSLGHRDMIDALKVMSDVAVDAGANTGDAGVVAENGGFDGWWKELIPRLNWTDSNHVGGVGRREKHTQKEQMWSPGEREDPEQQRGRRGQENGRKSLDP
jgi:hypothetical protein